MFVFISLPMDLPILAFSDTSFIRIFIICNSSFSRASSKMLNSSDLLTVSKAFDISNSSNMIL